MEFAVIAAVAAVFLFSAVGVQRRNYRTRHVKKDPRRAFTPAQRARIFQACNGRCEYPRPILGRCHRKATQADHIYPWSKGGPTTLENGAGLCAVHNRLKSNKVPSRAYMRRLAKYRMQQGVK